MLAVWCFTVFAAVGERLAVSGKRESARLAEHRQHLFRLLLLLFFFSAFAPVNSEDRCWLWL